MIPMEIGHRGGIGSQRSVKRYAQLTTRAQSAARLVLAEEAASPYESQWQLGHMVVAAVKHDCHSDAVCL